MGFGAGAGGKAIGGFFKDDLVAHYGNTELHNTQEQQALGLGALKAKADAASKAYADAIGRSTPEIEAINRTTMGTLGNLSDQFGSFDPVANYERVRAGNLASLGDQFTNIARRGEEGDKARLASLGYGGRGPSAYESVLRSDRISRNIAPVLGQIYSGLGSDVASLNQNRLANLAGTLELLQRRQAIPGTTDYRALLPYQAEAGMFGQQVDFGGNLANASRANFQGYETKKNPWKNFFEEGGKAGDELFDAALNVYTGGISGGLGGIGGGGGTGLMN